MKINNPNSLQLSLFEYSIELLQSTSKQLMIQKFQKHPHKAHFVTYAASYAAYGMLITGLGPIIPYFTAVTGIIETQYSFLFSCRSFGMLGGAILLKVLLHKFKLDHHYFLAATSFSLIFSSALFAWAPSTFLQGFWMVVSSFAYASLEIEVNVCALRINPPQQIQFWLLLIHGFFGVGGLLGPFLVYLFGFNAFPVIGLLYIILTILFLWLPSPQAISTLPAQNGEPTASALFVSRRVQVLLCIALFIYIGMENTYGGWISSYSILVGAGDKQNATLFPSIFWIMITVGRFLLAFLPGTSSTKMKWLLYGNIASAVLSLALVYSGFPRQACYISAIIFGISMSSLYILVISINHEFGFILEEYQTGNIITCGVLGEGFLTMLVGILMEKVHIDMLFYSLMIMPIFMEIIRRVCVNIFEEEKGKGRDNLIELLDKNTSQ